jgi:BirA family biotin operon repressor/biotin-[acetyl-CoA-carboxylase] ligase
MTIGQNIIRLQSVDSTNNFAATLAKEQLIDHGAVILAEEQTKGRGQMGNTWFSETGANLTFSVFLQPEHLLVNQQFILTKVISVTVVEVLSIFGIDAKIKWPNDILVGEKKIAGILIENTIESDRITAVVAGIGWNVNQANFLHFNGVSMFNLIGKSTDKNIVLMEFLKRLQYNWTCLSNPENFFYLREVYLSMLFGKNECRAFFVDGKRIEGTITTVNEHGLLGLEIADEQYFFNLKQLEFIFQNASLNFET